MSVESVSAETVNLAMDPTTDGALVFRQSGTVDLILPEMAAGQPIPSHLCLLGALAAKLKDPVFVNAALENLYDKMDQLKKGE
jgi:hypothetical protein